MKSLAIVNILLVLLYLGPLSLAQSIKFNKLLPGDANEVFSSVIETNYGYLICGGTIYNNYRSIVLIKTDEYGNEFERKFFGKPGFEYYEGSRRAFIEIHDEGYALAANLVNINTNEKSTLLMRFDIEGDTLWTKKYLTDTTYIAIFQCIQTADEGFTLIGAIDTLDEAADMLIIKTDSLGNLSWYETFGGNETDAGFNLIQSWDSGYMLAGTSLSYGSGNFPQDWYLVNTNEQGSQQWFNTFGSNSLNDGGTRGIIMTKDSNFVISGSYNILDLVNDNALTGKIIKFDNLGDIVWDKTYEELWGDDPYPENLYCFFSSASELPNNNIAIVATTKDFYGWLDAKLYLINSQGDSLWTRRYCSIDNTVVPLDEYLFDIQPTIDGGFVMAGIADSDYILSPYQQIWIVKTDCNGFDSLPEARFNVTISNNLVELINESIYADSCIWNFGDGSDLVYASAFDNIQHIFEDTGSYTISLVSYSSCDVNEADTLFSSCLISTVGYQEIFTNNSQFELYPNPNNGNMTLKYDLKVGDDGELVIYSIQGKEMKRCFLDSDNKQLNIVDDKGFVNGIYLYQIISGNEILKMDKLIILR